MADDGPGAPPPGRRFVEWVYETYRDQLRLPEAEGSRQYHDFIESMDIATFPLSGAVRVQSFHIIKFGYPMRRAGYLTAAFAARVSARGSASRQRETYYAYAYWPRDKGAGPPEYICLSPTFESRDGEYRHRFIWYKQFDEGYEANAPLLSPLEECLLGAIGEDELAIDVFFFPGDEGLPRGARAAAAAHVEASRLGLKALAATLAVDALRARGGTLQNHAYPAYAAVMRALYERCLPAVEAISPAVRHELSVFATGKAGRPGRAQCGQKLVPLTVREALQVNDINFAPWREAWVGRRATDLVVNGAAPMFPIFNNWTYLDGIDRSLFEGRAMHARYDRSLQAEGVAESLRGARALARRTAGSDYRMGQLDAHVYDALAYAQEFVLLTGLAMCSTSEFVGSTVRSLPEIVRHSAQVSPAFLRMYADPAMQARYLFDLCYGAHALHTRVGAVHADLHLNNMTVHELSSQYKGACGPEGLSFAARYRNPAIAYITGGRGEADTYVFPHDGWFACLIDFSRAILGPAARPAIAAESGEAFAAGFYRSQVGRALRVLHFYVPSYVEAHQEKIKGLLLADFDALFRVMTAVDFLAIGRNYGALLREVAAAGRGPGDQRALEVAPEGIATAARIERLALEHLVVHLTDLVEGGSGRRAAIPHAGDVVIPGAFDAFRYSAWAASADVAGAPRPFALADATLVDVYNGAAPLEYSGTDYSRFPPWARFDVLERHLGGIKLAQVTADRGERPFLRSLDLDGYLAVLQEQVRRTADDAPAAATSSWIAD
jgi:hypothetical protein